LTRLKETVEIINLLLAGTPLNYQGKLFKLSRGFKLRFEPLRKHIPIWIASLNSKSVEFTARRTDGWLPSMVPRSGLGRRSTSYVRLQRRQDAGRMKSRSNLPAT
jgi:alkanesulfonate monooxygenase SsuD/methylene tetrahydromethanopterin reductase-like flavin-dependent oxidoreductase (luciferase family)